MKLKIKFGGQALFSGKPHAKAISSSNGNGSRDHSEEVESLGLPEEQWRRPGPAKWKAHRQSAKAMKVVDHENQCVAAPSNSQQECQIVSEGVEAPQVEISPEQPDSEMTNSCPVNDGMPATSSPRAELSAHESFLPAATATAEPMRESHGQAAVQPEVRLKPEEQMPDLSTPDIGRSCEPVRDNTNAGQSQTAANESHALRQPQGLTAATQHPSEIVPAPNTDGQLLEKPPHPSGENCPSQSAVPTEQLVKLSRDAAPVVSRKRKERSTSPAPTSSALSTTSDSASESPGPSSRSLREKSREAGEMTDSELPRRSIEAPDYDEKRRRSGSGRPISADLRQRGDRPRHRDERTREWSREYERERHLDNERERQDYARYKRRLENFKRHEQEKREARQRLERRESYRSERSEERRSLKRSSSVISDDNRRRRSRSRSRRRSEERRPSRSISRHASPKKEDLYTVRKGSNASPAHRDTVDEVQPPLPPEEPAAASVPAPSGFADAWSLLMGFTQEDCGSEANIDDLHNAATAAKHRIDSLSKATNGKHTFENLVALMREAYLKYMQVGAIWETIARMPNPPANRNRARLADEGGMYPGTIGLMRQVASECRTCPANTEASAILRILAERLMAIMQMRIAQVQRNKIHQDRQFLLACPGAPQVDAFGRRKQGQESLGETFQRPSPTDSNASNSTSEQALPPALLHPTMKAPAPVAKGRGLPQNKAAPLGVRGGHVAKPTLNAKGNLAKRAKSTNPPNVGRDDAWAVVPICWEIPPAKFESEIRSWSILSGVMTYTAQLRAHQAEIEKLMRLDSRPIREAAGMLGFLDLGLGMSNIGAVLRLSQNILDLILQIQLNGAGPANWQTC